MFIITFLCISCDTPETTAVVSYPLFYYWSDIEDAAVMHKNTITKVEAVRGTVLTDRLMILLKIYLVTKRVPDEMVIIIAHAGHVEMVVSLSHKKAEKLKI